MNSDKHALYRFFNAAGDLLYIGITKNPSARWRSHSSGKDWWHEVTDIRLEVFLSRDAVLNAEQAAIKAESPRYNVVHNAAPLKPIQFDCPEIVLADALQETAAIFEVALTESQSAWIARSLDRSGFRLTDPNEVSPELRILLENRAQETSRPWVDAATWGERARNNREETVRLHQAEADTAAPLSTHDRTVLEAHKRAYARQRARGRALGSQNKPWIDAADRMIL